MKLTNALLLLRKMNLLFWYTGMIWRGLKGQKLVQLVQPKLVQLVQPKLEILLKCARTLKKR